MSESSNACTAQGGVLTSVMLGLQQQQLLDLPPLRLCIIFGSGPSRYPPHQVSFCKKLDGGLHSIPTLADALGERLHALMTW